MEWTAPKRRRDALASLAVAATVIPGFAIAAKHVVDFLVPKRLHQTREVLLTKLGRLPVGGSQSFEDVLGNALILVRLAGSDVRAFSVICTHLGCHVHWDQVAGDFLCPCHMGRFDATGAVTAGPPPAPLPSFPVRVDQDNVFVTVPVREA